MPFPFTPQSVPGPQAQPPAYSLLIAADTMNDDAGGDWQKGATWAPEQIGGGGIVAINCTPDTDALSTAVNPHLMTAVPFVVWAEDHCSTFGFQSRDFEGRARRQLAAIQSFEIAREFQLGAVRTAETLPNVALQDAIVIHPGDVDPVHAVAELEGAMGEAFKGRRGTIHLPAQVLTILNDGGMLTRAGQRWITPMGSIVAADAGYTSEADGFLYAYATGPVSVKLGRVILNPGSFDEADANGAIDWSTNSVKIYAEREALVQVDAVINDTPGSGSADAMWKVQLNVHAWALHS